MNNNTMKYLPIINKNIRSKSYVNKTKRNFQTFNIDYSNLPPLKFKKSNKVRSIELLGLGSYSKKITQYLSSTLDNSSNEIHKITDMLKKIIKDFIKKTNKDTAIIHLRVHLPNKNDKYNYKTPRWHTDGKYFPNMKNHQFKLFTTIHGKSTLIHKWNKTYSDHIREYREHMLKNILPLADNTLIYYKKLISARKKLAKKLNNPADNTYNSAYGLVNGNMATIHSEPHFDDYRLFMAVLPSTKKNMDEKKIFRKKQKITY